MNKTVYADHVKYYNNSVNFKVGEIVNFNNTLFFEDNDMIKYLSDDENIVISNIDSPNENNTIVCCNCKLIASAMDEDNTRFYCPKCKTIIDTNNAEV